MTSPRDLRSAKPQDTTIVVNGVTIPVVRSTMREEYDPEDLPEDMTCHWTPRS